MSGRRNPGGGRTASKASSDLSSLARGSSLNLVGAIVTGVLHTLVLVTVTRSFGKEQAGTFFVATSLFLLLTASSAFGADTGVLRLIPRSRALGRQGDIPAYLRAGSWPVLVLATCIAVLLWFLAPAVAVLAVGERQADNFVTAIRVLAPFVPIVVTNNVTLSATRGFGTMRPTVFIEKIGRSVAQWLAVFSVQFVDDSMFLLAAAWVTPYAGSALIGSWWLRRLVRRGAARAAGEARATARAVAAEFWKFSGPRGLSRLFAVALQRVDIILVGALRGPADAAIYAAATRFLIIGLMAVQAIQQVMSPKISQFLTTSEGNRAAAVYQTSTSWLMALTWPMYLFFAVFAPVLLQLFGPGYEAGSTAVVILCLAMLVSTACGSVDSVLLMGGRSSWSLLNTGLALAVNVALDFLLIPTYGVTGAAVAWAAAILLNNLVPLLQVHLFLHLHPFGPGSRGIAPLALVCFGGIPLLARLVLGLDAAVVIASTVLAVAAYAVGLWPLRHRMELAAMGSALRLRRRGPGGQAPRPRAESVTAGAKSS